MREIAEEARLSPANLYHYFAGKHEILYFCQDRALDAMLRALDTIRLSGGPVGSRLRAILEAHARIILDDLEGSVAHLEVDALPEDLRARAVRKRDRYERGIRAWVREGIRTGAFERRDPALVVRAMLGAVNWTAQWFRPDGGRSAGSVASELADFLVAGLGRHAAPSKRGRGAATG
jgi:AcrR family transcriptional regulator